MTESAPAVTADPPQPHRPWKLHRKKLLSVETANMKPLVGLRNAIGVAAPLALGVALGNPIAGVAAGFGARCKSRTLIVQDRTANVPGGC